MDPLAWLSSLTSRRLSRRSAGVVGVALVTALSLPAETSARRKKRKAREKTVHNYQDGGNGAGQDLWCGGITGKPCPAGYDCIDDPGDDCDPNTGGADCGGICVRSIDQPNPCAAMLCQENTDCCPNCGGMCVPVGTTCSDDLCQGEPGPPSEEFCGTRFCAHGEYCCNPYCGVCIQHGQPCPQVKCASPGEGVVCGKISCPIGQECCNASCGICTPPGGVCIMIACVDRSGAV